MFTIDAATDEEAGDLLSRFAVGLIDSLPMKNFKAVLKKFGKEEAIKDLPTGQPGTIQLSNRKPDWQTRISLFNGDRSETVEFHLDTYATAGLFPWLPVRFQRVRFAGQMLSFMWRGIDEDVAGFTASFQIPNGDTPAQLSQLARVCRAARMFAEAPAKGLYVSLDPGSTKEVPAMSLSKAAAFEPEFLDFAAVVEQAGQLARLFDLDSDSIVVRPSELLGRRFAIRMFASGLDRSMSQVDIRVGIEPVDPVAGKRAALIVPAIVPLGPHVLAAAFTLEGIADWKHMPDDAGTMGIVGADVRLRFKRWSLDLSGTQKP
jgi:hypothetical protein